MSDINTSKASLGTPVLSENPEKLEHFGKCTSSEIARRVEYKRFSGVEFKITTFNKICSLPQKKSYRYQSIAAMDILKFKQIALSYPRGWPIHITARKTRISSRFGKRRSQGGGRSKYHAGIDIAALRGEPITATGNGVVKFAGRKGLYGKVVIIDHGNGYETIYGHCHRLKVKTGDKVEMGQIISTVGNTGRSTGNHLHYEIRLNGKVVNPEKMIRGFKRGRRQVDGRFLSSSRRRVRRSHRK